MLFRLDYGYGVENWDKDSGTRSIHFISHWLGKGRLQLFVLKNAERVQSLANVYVRAMANLPDTEEIGTNKCDSNSSGPYLRLDKMEKEIRRIQLLALQTWIAENGSIDLSTLDQLMNQVARAVSKERLSRFQFYHYQYTASWIQIYLNSPLPGSPWALFRQFKTNSPKRICLNGNCIRKKKWRQPIACCNRQMVVRFPLMSTSYFAVLTSNRFVDLHRKSQIR